MGVLISLACDIIEDDVIGAVGVGYIRPARRTEFIGNVTSLAVRMYTAPTEAALLASGPEVSGPYGFALLASGPEVSGPYGRRHC